MRQLEPMRPMVSNSRPEVMGLPSSSVYTCEQLMMQPAHAAVLEVGHGTARFMSSTMCSPVMVSAFS